MMGGHPSQETIRNGDVQDASPRGHALFLVNDTGLRVVPLPASGALVIGRGGDVDVRVADSRMSRRHLRLQLGAAFLIEDLHSANGTSVGGQLLRPGEPRAFAPGDTIVAGATTMLVRAQKYPLTTSATDKAVVEPVAAGRLRAVLELADRAAVSMISVLLLGETGVGKDVLAERIHRASPRASGPFVRVNCAAFSSTLLESELFGHEKGAFTGATSARLGLLQSAHGGTVFLDEVGDLPQDHQAKLLLALERREVLPVGSVRPRPVDVRFVSATNHDLPRDVAAGVFRRDLYFRLNGITIEVPPLRTRVSEIATLARAFARDAARSIGKPPPDLSSEALAVLHAHPWPGNIRELRSVIERAVLLAADPVLRPHDIAFSAAGAPPPDVVSAVAPEVTARVAVGDTAPERQQLVDALAQCAGNQSRAAKLLGISRNTLIARIAKYGLARPLSPRST
jgi:DNA-binding NtrC family response regulator